MKPKFSDTSLGIRNFAEKNVYEPGQLFQNLLLGEIGCNTYLCCTLCIHPFFDRHYCSLHKQKQHKDAPKVEKTHLVQAISKIWNMELWNGMMEWNDGIE